MSLRLVAVLLTLSACGLDPGATADNERAGQLTADPVIHGDPAFIIDITTPADGQTLTAAELTEVSGEFTDALVEVESVDVALVQPGEECAWWSVRKAMPIGRECDAPLWNPAELGDGTWTLPLRGPLPTGEWTATVRGNEDDHASGLTEIGFVLA